MKAVGSVPPLAGASAANPAAISTTAVVRRERRNMGKPLVGNDCRSSAPELDANRARATQEIGGVITTHAAAQRRRKSRVEDSRTFPIGSLIHPADPVRSTFTSAPGGRSWNCHNFAL